MNDLAAAFLNFHLDALLVLKFTDCTNQVLGSQHLLTTEKLNAWVSTQELPGNL